MILTAKGAKFSVKVANLKVPESRIAGFSGTFFFLTVCTYLIFVLTLTFWIFRTTLTGSSR